MSLFDEDTHIERKNLHMKQTGWAFFFIGMGNTLALTLWCGFTSVANITGDIFFGIFCGALAYFLAGLLK